MRKLLLGLSLLFFSKIGFGSPALNQKLFNEVSFGCLFKVKDLIEARANINAEEWDGWTALHYASNSHENLSIVRYLLQNGANINAKHCLGKTPLFIASQNGHLGVVNLLLKNCADVNQADIHGATPLHVASREGHKDVVRLLIEKGANVDEQDKFVQTPLDVAENDEIKRTLKRWPLQVAQARQKTIDLRVHLLLTLSKRNNIPLEIFRKFFEEIKIEPKTTDPLPYDHAAIKI